MHWSILTSTMSGRAVPQYVRYRTDQTAENVAAYDCVQTELVMAQYGEVFKNMKIFKATGGFSRLRPGKHMMAALMPLSLLFAAWPQNLLADQDAPAPAPAATSRGVATAGCADCAVFGFARGSGSGCIHVSRASR